MPIQLYPVLPYSVHCGYAMCHYAERRYAEGLVAIAAPCLTKESQILAQSYKTFYSCNLRIFVIT